MHSAKEEKKIPKNSLENVSSFITIKVDTESRYEAYVRVGGVITPAQFDNRSSWGNQEGCPQKDKQIMKRNSVTYLAG